MIKAIFFDLDGVLVNSEWQDQKWTREYARMMNLTIPEERFYYLIGTNKRQNPWTKILEGYENEIQDLEQFRQGLRAFKTKKRSMFNFSEVLFEEVPDVLSQLKSKGIKIACASSSTMEYIQQALSQTGLLPYFDMICTGHDFKESKPAPDIYLYCQNYFGFVKEECLIVEDSPLGIQAGKSAGMNVVARATPFGLDQSQADWRINNMKELLLIVNELNDF